MLNRNDSVEPFLLNHRDPMNPEKTKDPQAERRSLLSDFRELTPSLVFLGVHLVSVVFSPVFSFMETLRRSNHS